MCHQAPPYYYVTYIDLPATLISAISNTQVHPPTWESPCLRPKISVCHTRSFTHLGVSCLRPSMPTTNPVLPLPYGSVSYCVAISPPILLPLDYLESAKVAINCFSVASWRHHDSLLRPTSSYPVSLLHISNKGRSATHCSTFSCRLYMLVLADCVPAASYTTSVPGVSHVLYPNCLTSFPVIIRRNYMCVPSTLFAIIETIKEIKYIASISG